MPDLVLLDVLKDTVKGKGKENSGYMERQSIVFTNDRCIGCNKCINVCSAIGACVSKEEGGKARIEVDGSKCVACGSCIDVCVHGAREFEDDTERFFKDLEKGERISLLLAPAFKANYPDEYERVLGSLKQMGVRRIISVSFGADICTWGYLNYIKDYEFLGGISQPCPAVVSYIERYLPELLPKLFPVQSPLMCAAIYARNELGITDRFAFISPCIAKKLEIEDPHNKGLVQYNVTFEHLMHYLEKYPVSSQTAHSEVEYGLGSFYPTPGGLAENVRWFLGEQVFIRQIEGERHLYEWMHQNEDRIRHEKTPFLIIDALNCEKGCICGTAVNPEKAKTDDALYALLRIREEAKKKEGGNAWSVADTKEERLKQFNRQFAGLNLADYLRGYTDRSAECSYKVPGEEELEGIFFSMNKLTKESREINCTCCGYEGCVQMATAIYNGFNHKENCIYYEKAMVHELEIEKAVAEEAAEAKDAFLANMSHEIRTPINAVLGMNEMILRESRENNILAYAENIRSSGNTLLGLVNNILDFSKIEAGKLTIEPVEYDLSSVINDLVNMVQLKADDKGLTISLDFDSDIPKCLYGDELRIKQVVTNLLTNAVKYTEKGSVTFRIYHEKLRDDLNHVLLHVEVEDTGIGIKKEDMERLFSEFERIEEKRNRNIEGTGLGMNITKSLLEMMGSSLYVKSEYEKGSTFGFSLKQEVIRWESLGDYETAYRKLVLERKPDREKFIAPDAEILVVDDNAMNLVVFESLLARTQIKIDTANDGDEALTMAYDKKYDIIFFDYMMPKKDGIETLKEMREQKKNPNLTTPSICLTANAVSGAREQYLAAGFNDYLTKPVNSSKLEEVLMYYLPEKKIRVRQVEEEVPASEEDEKKDELQKKLAVLEEKNMLSVEEGIHNSGSVNAYMALLKIFYQSIDAKAAEIGDLYAAGDMKGYTIKVHALKSSAKIVGAMNLGEMAQRLENAGKSGDVTFIGEHQETFMEDYYRFQTYLEDVFTEKEDDSERPEADVILMKEAYEEIRVAAEDMDCDRLEEIFSEMEGYRIPKEEEELFTQLKEAVDQFDYETVCMLLQLQPVHFF